jgi:LysM repeat protein
MHRLRGLAGIVATSAAAVLVIGALATGAMKNQSFNGPASATNGSSFYVPAAVQSPSAKINHLKIGGTTAPKEISRPTLAHMPNQYYRVESGDTLSSIAIDKYGNASDWPAIYWANKKSIEYANDIEVGQNLLIPASHRYAPVPQSDIAPAAPAPVVTVDAAVQSTHHSVAAAATPQSSQQGYAVTSSFQSCVIRAESGGNSQVMNSSGHYGLYQFSESTWEEYGGSAAEFGDATPAEQTQVFDNAMASPGGADNWAPYDGC